ncbi:MAG: DUF1573 domain-containing protein [Candidatus Bipolaricaulia bacterium]
MNLSKKVIYTGVTITAVGLTIGLLLIFVAGNNGTVAGEIIVRPSEYDLGNVPYGGGIIEREFTVKNRGNEKLKITSIKTSCGCTEAQLIYDGNKSKKFGMHPNNLVWAQTIGPGDQATLKVFFDPTAHGPEGVGPFRRAIWIESSDEKAEARIQGSVTR